MTEDPEKTVPEPLSPELVLVDPQLANVARERLRVIGETAALGKRAVAPRAAGFPPRVVRTHTRPATSTPSAFQANEFRWSAQRLGRQTITWGR